MKTVYFATGNKGKYNSLKRDLASYDIKLVHFPSIFEKELESEDVGEIACDKVLRTYVKMKKAVIAVDAGFYIDSLNGYPGPEVNPALKKGLQDILERLKGKGRTCKFRQCLAYTDSEMDSPKVFESITEGRLSEEERGSDKPYLWSKLGLIFIPSSESKTLAEMTKEEYNSWRAKRGKEAVGHKFGEWYSQN